MAQLVSLAIQRKGNSDLTVLGRILSFLGIGSILIVMRPEIVFEQKKNHEPTSRSTSCDVRHVSYS